MPWKECNPMDEHLRFVARVLEGEEMSFVCRELGISRKTGYINVRTLHGLRLAEVREPKQATIRLAASMGPWFMTDDVLQV